MDVVDRLQAVLALVTLCDMVLGEDAADRTDKALIQGVGNLMRENAALVAANEQMRDALEEVEWVDDLTGQDESISYCPWCRGVQPLQRQANFKAQELETCIGHTLDCPRQTALTAAGTEDK